MNVLAYYLTYEGGPEREVSESDWLNAERNAGFTSKVPGTRATGGFSGNGISGRLVYDQGIQKFEDAIKALEPNTYYRVEVSLFAGNPPFSGILFTGFPEGGYRSFWSVSGVIDLAAYPKTLIVVRGKIVTDKSPHWSGDTWMTR